MGVCSRHFHLDDPWALDHQERKRNPMQATAVYSERAPWDCFDGASTIEVSTSSFISDTRLSATAKTSQCEISQDSVVNSGSSQRGSISFWGLILLLCSAGLILFGLYQILKSKKDLHHLQSLFSCAYGYSVLMRSKIERMHAMTKKIVWIRKAELAAKSIPLPPSQAAAKTLEASRIILETLQNGFIQMSNADLMKYQISSCRRIHWMHGPPLGLNGFKIERDKILRFPLLKQNWSTCMKHFEHSIKMDQKQIPTFYLKSIYGTSHVPCL
ncbi:MAG: hypothetical protein QE271_07800 [Bacteriovoracaceae bacterium]|nr:hypothetical protein [Bacteriovoracaceae bacterium]